MKLNLIVPLAGYGSRFYNAGYKTYKPFLKINKFDNMITNICKKFPTSTRKYFIVNNLIKKNYIKLLKKISNSTIITVKHHKLGPVETILRASKQFNNLENIFFSYCDITWKWDFKNIELNNNKVYCFKGWHPFTKNNNNYAFCKSDKKNNLIKIKEKESFTNSWQNEPLSIGLFFYKNFNTMINSFKIIKKKKISTNSEYFPSEAFNFIKNSKIETVDSFIHIGKPDYLEEYKNWQIFFNIKKPFIKKINKAKIADKYLIPAAGKGERFRKEKIYKPKFLYKINNQNLKTIDYINLFLPNKKKNIILLKKNKYTKYLNKKKFKLHFLNKKTKGQAFTIFEILKKFDHKKSFFINSCDVFSTFNIKKFLILKKTSDIIIFVSSKSFTELPDRAYTWVDSYNNNLKDIFVKKKPKKNLKILTGNFYFKNKIIYNKCFDRSLKNFNSKELYIDNLLKHGKKLGFKINVIEDENYINFGTPSLIKDFIFWKDYFN